MLVKLSSKHVRYQGYNFTPWSCPWPPTAPPPCSWPSDTSEAPEYGPKWFPLPKKHLFWRQIKSLVCSEPKLKCHSLKLALASSLSSTLFLTFRLIWSSWKWSQMIPNTKKYGDRHQNQVSSMVRSKVTNYLTIDQISFYGRKCGFWRITKLLRNWKRLH